MENLIPHFKGKFFDSRDFPHIRVKIGEISYRFHCQVTNNDSSCLVCLRSSEIFDQRGDVQTFFKQKLVRVEFFEAEENITEFSFELQVVQVPEICEIEWNRFMEQMVISIIIIQVNNCKDSSDSGMKISWIPEKVENLDIPTVSIMIFNIFSYSYTFSFEFRYLSSEDYETDKKILKSLQTNPDTECLFCLFGAVFDDDQQKIVFQEPIEINDLDTIEESLTSCLNEIKQQQIAANVFLKQEPSQFLKVSVENSIFFSPSVLKKLNFNYSDILPNNPSKDSCSFSTVSAIETKLNSLSSISFSRLIPAERFNNQGDYFSSTCFSIEQFPTVFYNFNRFRALRHKNLVKVFGIRENDGKYELVTEKLEPVSFEDDIKPLKRKQKLKILKQLTSLVNFCQLRGYFFIGLDPNNLFFDKNKNIKLGLCYFGGLYDDSLESSEESLGLVARNTENFRLGLLIKKLFLEDEVSDPTLERDSWLIRNIQVFRESVLRKDPLMCQLVTELTNIDPGRRLECKNLLEILENR